MDLKVEFKILILSLENNKTNLDKSCKTCKNRKDQNDNFCPRIDPEHLPAELWAVFHDKENNENDDASDQTEQTKEQT